LHDILMSGGKPSYLNRHRARGIFGVCSPPTRVSDNPHPMWRAARRTDRREFVRLGP
jgi:hypothetical protein